MGGPALVRHLDRMERDGHRAAPPRRRRPPDRPGHRHRRRPGPPRGDRRGHRAAATRRCGPCSTTTSRSSCRRALDKVFAFALSQLEGTEPPSARRHEEHAMTTTTSPAAHPRRGRRTTTPSSAPSASPRSTRATSAPSTASTSSVHRGEIFGLLGPNGAGKTTTAGMLTTRVIPTAGHGARRRHRRRARTRPQAKRLIGVVPQTNTLDRSLTVWENLYFHGRFFGMDARTREGRGDPAARAVPPHRAVATPGSTPSPAAWPSG